MIAFLSLAAQARGLWGSRGVLPASGYLEAVEQATDRSRYLQLPTAFWLSSSDAVLTGAAVAGVIAAAAALFGFATGWMLLLCYVLYLSFCNVGQDFLSFQWDALLLEAGFLALFAAPWSWQWQPSLALEPHWLVRFAFYILLFKLMFLSGVVKLASGDPAWRDMTALRYHYWTQPLPNPLSPFLHAMPLWFHRLSTVGTFVIELVLPFLIFWPRTRALTAIGFTVLSAFIFISGNYTFFNILTVALCAWLLPDSFWQAALDRLGWALSTAPGPAAGPSVSAAAAAVLIFISVFWCARYVLPESAERAMLPVLRYVQGFHLSSPYGLFATMTKSRPEIVIEGSSDGQTWREYEFKYKPGPLKRRPPVIEPFQPRLDWQMWFAALGTFRNNLWVQNLIIRLFEASPEVLGFFSGNPFPEAPPKFIRARLYEYEFETPGEIFSHGVWWKRTLVGEYSPTYQRPD